jgi:predicted permease
VKDLRQAVRGLVQSPGFTLVALVTLTLGIGINTTIFSFVNAVLLRPLPFPRPDELVCVRQIFPNRPDTLGITSVPTFHDWRDRNRTFSGMAASSEWPLNVTSGGAPETVKGAVVSADFFSILENAIGRGRGFRKGEDVAGRDLVAVISDGFWKRRFGSDQSVVGRVVTINGKPTTVVGIARPGFEPPFLQAGTEVYVPLSHAFGQESRNGNFLQVIGRLARGVRPEAAAADMASVMGGLTREYPDIYAGRSVHVVPLGSALVSGTRPALLLLSGIVLLVLLIGSANVAGMMLARASARQREIAIRTALGATRRDLVRQLLTESVVLFVVGGVLAALFSVWSLDALVAWLPFELPRASEISVDGRVLLYTLVLSVVAGAAFGLLPALQASRLDVSSSLKDGASAATGGEGRRRARRILVVAEIALSLVVLAGAGLLIRSLERLYAVDPGFDGIGVTTLVLETTPGKYDGRENALVAFHDRLIERIAARPGVRSVASVTFLPYSGDYANLAFEIEGRPSARGDRRTALENTVSPGYFGTLRIPLKRGRLFDAGDVEKPGSDRAAIVNEALARIDFPGEDPIGRRITFGDPNKPDAHWYRIVGVVGDTRALSLQAAPDRQVYIPYAQAPDARISLLVRSDAPISAISALVRSEVAALDREQPVRDAQPFSRIVSASLGGERARAAAVGLFALLALVLAMVGVYGVISYSVARRTQEIGIRVALGARREDVVRMVVGEGVRLFALGGAVGLAGALLASRALARFLFGVGAADPITFLAASALLGLAALAASWIPARRAAALDPLRALRTQ